MKTPDYEGWFDSVEEERQEKWADYIKRHTYTCCVCGCEFTDTEHNGRDIPIFNYETGKITHHYICADCYESAEEIEDEDEEGDF